MRYFILIFWYICTIFGNQFLQYSIGPLNPFYIFSFICLGYTFFKIIDAVKYHKSFFLNKFMIILVTFVILNFFYISISFLHFTNIFDLDILYDSSYIFRQGYHIFIIAIGVTCYHAFKNKKLNINFLRILLIMILALNFLECDGIILQGILMFTLVNLFYKDSKFNFIYLCITLWWAYMNLHGMTTYATIYLLAFIFMFYHFISKKIQLERVKRIFIFLSLPILLIALVVFASKSVSSDLNTQWRFQYWVDEFNTLCKTRFLGVGFGTSYCSVGFLSVVNNNNMFIQNYPHSIFVTTQHSSYINMFYRMGLIGGIIFTLIILYPFTQYKRYFKHNKEVFVIYIASLFTVVVNPGLESPRFMLFYIFSAAYLFAEFYNSSKIHLECQVSQNKMQSINNRFITCGGKL